MDALFKKFPCWNVTPIHFTDFHKKPLAMGVLYHQAENMG
jgi:hypothetical protein